MGLFPSERKRRGGSRARQAAPWIDRVARFGYVAKGMLYVGLGGLAARAAIGVGGAGTGERAQGSAGALFTVLQQPFGQYLLSILALGLLGHAAWRFVQAWMGPESTGGRGTGAATRVGYAASGLIHLALTVEAARIIFTPASNRVGGWADHWTTALMGQPFGRWVVGIVGAGLFAFGLYVLWRASVVGVGARLDLTGLGARARGWLTGLGRVGLVARGIVIALLGLFFFQAARQYDASEARGLGGTLQTLREQPYGPWLLGAVALGLLAYGLFQFAKARWRTIQAA